jgi:site-specific recombinase XerD
MMRPPVDPLETDVADAEEVAARAWEAAVEAFLSDRALAAETQRKHRRSLTAAGARLGFPTPEDLGRAAVAGYRARLVAEGTSETRIEAAIAALASFLKWAGQRRALADGAARAAGAAPGRAREERPW